MTVNELLPRPWRFEWKDAPQIIAANGRVVAVVTTGTIHGAYSTEVILQLGRELIDREGVKELAEDVLRLQALHAQYAKMLDCHPAFIAETIEQLRDAAGWSE